jgi:hypothetical protein
MSMTDIAKDLFKEIGEADLAVDRILDPAKSLAETVSIHLKQPSTPIMAR